MGWGAGGGGGAVSDVFLLLCISCLLWNTAIMGIILISFDIFICRIIPS